MRFEVMPLGTGAALPAQGRFPSAQLVNVNEHLFLVDCGEGTQERLRMAGVNFNRIRTVLISHLHGDHYLGLMGLISTMHLNGRTVPLRIHGPAPLKEIIDLQLRVSQTWLRYPLEFQPHPEQEGAVLVATPELEVIALELRHRLPTTGFLFRERPRPRGLRRERAAEIPHFMRGRVKAGEDLVFPDGRVIPNAELTTDPPPARSYAYCSDTAPRPELLPLITGVDLLYHEATFTEELAARAKETLHSTARQAATVAEAAKVGQLLLGHFSSRYKNPERLLREALAVFPRTRIAQEGATYVVGDRRSGDDRG